MPNSDRSIAIVTGAAGGIGSATTMLFRDRGWFVVGIDRDLPPSSHVVCDFFLHANISEPDTAKTIRSHLADLAITRVDALVNNAAMQITERLIDTSPDDWDSVMANNVRSVALASQAVFPMMEPGGAVVNVSSVHAIATSRGIAAYASSKGALLALTRAMALEFADEGIRVNAVLPGAVDTQMLRTGLRRRPEDGETEAAIRALGGRTPLGRVGKPEEIAEAIHFLADSSRSSFITGQSLVIDGGATARLSTE